MLKVHIRAVADVTVNTKGCRTMSEVLERVSKTAGMPAEGMDHFALVYKKDRIEFFVLDIKYWEVTLQGANLHLVSQEDKANEIVQAMDRVLTELDFSSGGMDIAQLEHLMKYNVGMNLHACE